MDYRFIANDFLQSACFFVPPNTRFATTGTRPLQNLQSVAARKHHTNDL
ncbi:hypothetical protein LCAA2362_0795 [Lacticaseibacillus casei A2-362]|nr:hypothetical protein LCAA2362_0795 [Lacticaseibacillus casei A2-362]